LCSETRPSHRWSLQTAGHTSCTPCLEWLLGQRPRLQFFKFKFELKFYFYFWKFLFIYCMRILTYVASFLEVAISNKIIVNQKFKPLFFIFISIIFFIYPIAKHIITAEDCKGCESPLYFGEFVTPVKSLYNQA
jgi:hypothetical protein